MTDDYWAGRSAIITGGAGGIGLATARALLDHGASVLLVDVNARRLNHASVALGGLGRGRVAVACSPIADPASCAAVLAAAPAPPLALVHLAGLYEIDDLDGDDRAVWQRAIASNLTTAYDMALGFARVVSSERSRQPARIVLTSSIAFRRGGPDNIAYSAAKGGIVGLTRALARRFAPRILVNAVAPGVIETSMTKGLIERRGPFFKAEIPLGRWGRAEEVAGVIRFLCGPDATYITGQTLTIDGGLTNA
jgi:NAD(P)-dependent dehydrogenase (short-subunit alcohol dehydrogenase family)